jgi:tRNA threonylcarbamoyl adenosine modification protein (Sua5/YciO/YrdC/YwlC family)
MPPPVLVSATTTLDALAVRVPSWARALVEEFWPGALTLVCHAHASLQWDLGDTRGTVAVRMPDHQLALDVLERTGPLAVSSANLSGLPAATEAAAAEGMLGDSVEVVLDGGPSPQLRASTILDVRGERPRLLRLGALSLPRLDAVLEQLGATVLVDDPDDPDDEPDDELDDTDDAGDTETDDAAETETETDADPDPDPDETADGPDAADKPAHEQD